jgi:hypothetical protein
MFGKRMNIKHGANVFGELLLIIVGINIALWFEGVFEDLRDSEMEVQYLEGLAEDLQVDLDHLESVIHSNRTKLNNIGKAMPMLDELIDAAPDQKAAIIFEPSNYLFFEPSDFTYQSMRESGDFRLLSNTDVKSDLLRLVRHYRQIEKLQANFLQALDSGYIPLIMNSVDIVNKRITDPSLVQDQLFLNFFPYTYQDTDARVRSYVAAKNLASTLLNDIRLQLGDN